MFGRSCQWSGCGGRHDHDVPPGRGRRRGRPPSLGCPWLRWAGRVNAVISCQGCQIRRWRALILTLAGVCVFEKSVGRNVFESVTSSVSGKSRPGPRAAAPGSCPPAPKAQHKWVTARLAAECRHGRCLGVRRGRPPKELHPWVIGVRGDASSARAGSDPGVACAGGDADPSRSGDGGGPCPADSSRSTGEDQTGMMRDKRRATPLVPLLATGWSHAHGGKPLNVVPCRWRMTT